MLKKISSIILVILISSVNMVYAIVVKPFDFSVSFLYDGSYTEAVLLPGEQLETEISVRNESAESRTFEVYMTLHNKNELEQVALENPTINSGEVKKIMLSLNLPEDIENYVATIFVWQCNTHIPMISSFKITPMHSDYYGNDYTTAESLQLEQEVNGKINYFGDIDVFEFTAQKDGLYVFESYGDTDTYVTLYKSSNLVTPVASDDNSGLDSNFRLSATLTAGERYYLYVCGHTVGDYSMQSMCAIGNIIGTVSPVKFYDDDFEFNENIEAKVTFTAYATSEFVATMHLKDLSSEDSEYASFDITGMHGGTYLVCFSRLGYLKRYRKIMLNDNVIDLGNVTLLAGDVNDDDIIDANDANLLESLNGKQYGDEAYIVSADLNGDKVIDSADLALLNVNLSKSSNTYGENVNVIKVNANISGASLNISGTAMPSSSVIVNIYQGDIGIFSELVAVDASGNYLASCTLTKAGAYTIVVTSDNRAVDAVVQCVYN